jgi:hypothetical protein
LTRDISLIDAFLDIVDNSINSTIKMENLALTTVGDYRKLLGKLNSKKKAQITISISEAVIQISDTAGGISFADAKEDVFRFGRSDGEKSGDRLSVYGIGFKRAR